MAGREDARRLTADGLDELANATPDRNQAAVSLFEDALAADAHFASAYEGLAQAYLQRTEELGLGTQWLDRAAAAATHALDLEQSLAEATYVLARTYRIRGWLREEQEVWRRRLKLAPEDSVAAERLGWVLWFSGHAGEALPWLHAAAEARPSGRWVHFFLGNAQLALGHFDEAERMYRVALEVDPNHSSAQAGVIWSLLAAREDDQARAELRAFQAHPFDDDRYQLKLADLEYFLNEKARAIEHAKQALREPEERYWPRGFLATTLLGAGLWSEDRSAAEELLTRSERIDATRLAGGDQGFMAHIDLAAIKSIRGEIDGALDSFRAAIAAGWRYRALAARDRLFENVKGEPGLAALLESA